MENFADFFNKNAQKNKNSYKNYLHYIIQTRKYFFPTSGKRKLHLSKKYLKIIFSV